MQQLAYLKISFYKMSLTYRCIKYQAIPKNLLLITRVYRQNIWLLKVILDPSRRFVVWI